jgi:metal-responsive CopG/Arc/MetJ family transcriptional regulator
MKNEKRINVTIPDKLMTEFNVKIALNNTNKKDVVTTLIRNYINGESKIDLKNLRKKLVLENKENIDKFKKSIEFKTSDFVQIAKIKGQIELIDKIESEEKIKNG